MANAARKIALSTIGYTIGTFVLAVMWHVVVFENLYIRLGYFEGEPNFLLGLVTILLQGLALSALFPAVSFSGSTFVRTAKFSALLGGFFWTSHVLAFLAKQNISDPLIFIAAESCYLVLQFGLFSFVLWLVYKNDVAT